MNKVIAKIKIEYFLYIIIAAALVTSLYLNYVRICAEFKNKTVEIAVDYESITSLSSLTGVPLSKILSRTAKAGITSLAVAEDNINTLERDGKLVCYSGYEVINFIQMNQLNTAIQYLMRYTQVKPEYTYLVINDTFLFDRVKAAFLLEMGEDNVKILSTSILELKGKEKDLLGIGLGYSSSEMQILNNYGFALIPRLSNSNRLDDNGLALKINNVSESGKFFTIIFDKDSILGYPKDLATVAGKMKRYNLNYGLVEFGKQKGDNQLAQLIPERTIRVHSVQAREQGKLQEDAIISRYLRAVEERGIRILYVRPWLDFEVSRDLFGHNIEYFSSLSSRLRTRGYKVAVIKSPLLVLERPDTWMLVLIAFGIWAALILLLKRIIRFTSFWLFSVSGALLLLGILCSLLPDPMPRKIAAFLSAALFPPLILLSCFPDFEPCRKPARRILTILTKAGIIAGCALFTGLVISALLGETSFLLTINVFSGVKLAFIFPLLVMGGLLMYTPVHLQGLIAKTRRILASPVSVAHIMLGGLVLVAAAILLLRSGNSSDYLVTGAEGRLRSLLETLFFIRPRFKECIIGYPALVILCWYAGTYISKRWYGLFLLAVTLIPISIVNSFCHTHTPVLYSILRTVNGLVLGIVVGFIMVYIIRLFIRVGQYISD
ncbi:MAG: DUF5693 family protein [Candidatus Margulisiibacteriota bacterium]